MTQIHIVKSGECLSSIAAKAGFRRWQTIYEDPDNEEFRQLRPNPNIIFPGDRLVIPAIAREQVQLGTGRTHRLRVPSQLTQLRVELFDGSVGAMLDARYELRISGSSDIIEGELDGGQLRTDIPAAARSAHLIVFAHDSGRPIAEFMLHLGHLDPHDTLSGMQARLTALGYDCGAIDGR